MLRAEGRPGDARLTDLLRHAAHAEEASCRSPCVWCVASAVPSACFNAKNAARLPAGVFTCKSDTGEDALGADVAATS